jgi:hypothetical protein
MFQHFSKAQQKCLSEYGGLPHVEFDPCDLASSECPIANCVFRAESVVIPEFLRELRQDCEDCPECYPTNRDVRRIKAFIKKWTPHQEPNNK